MESYPSFTTAPVKVVTQSCPTLCDPMDCSLQGSSVHGILQARILEWVTIPFSWDLPNLEIQPRSPALQVDSLPSEPPGQMLNQSQVVVTAVATGGHGYETLSIRN